MNKKDEPMKIRIKWLNAYADAVRHVDINVHSENNEDDITEALIKLLRHSWTPGVGDSIKIEEA
jgi:hypothetical protein